MIKKTLLNQWHVRILFLDVMLWLLSNVYELHVDVELYLGEILIDLLSGQTKKISSIMEELMKTLNV